MEAGAVDTRQWMSVLLCLATALMLFVACLSYVKRQQPMARTMIWMMVTASCGFFILQSMMGSTISNFVKDFQNYWQIGKIVLKIVKREVS